MVSNVRDVREDIALNIYPNPTRGAFTALFSAPLPESCFVRIMDSEGKVLYVAKNSGLRTEASFSLDYPDGVYLFQVIDEENNVLSSRKIVKAR